MIKRTTESIKKVNQLVLNLSGSRDADAISTVPDIIPRLISLTFVDVLKEKGMLYLACEREADLTTAELSIHLNCPVASGDSDFLVYRPPIGKQYRFVFLDSLDPNILKPSPNAPNRPNEQSNYYMPCKILNNCGPFYTLNFTVLPILAVLVGNDTISNVRVPPVLQSTICLDKSIKSYNQKRIKALVDWISGFSEQLEEIFIQILSLYDYKELKSIMKLLQNGLMDYALDVTVSGHNAAYLLGLESDGLRKSVSRSFNSFVFKDGRSESIHDAACTFKDIVKRLNEAKTFVKLDQENEMEDSIFYRWPMDLIKRFRSLEISPSALNVLYVPNGISVQTLVEDLEVPTSIHGCSLDLRKLYWGLMVGLEYFLGNGSKLIGLHDRMAVSYNRAKELTLLKEYIPIDEIAFDVSKPCTIWCASLFKQFLHININTNVRCAELQGLSVLLSLWYKYSFYARQSSVGIVSSPVGLAILCCALAAKYNHQFLAGHNRSNNELYDWFSQYSSYAKEQFSFKQIPTYCIRIVHQINELQIIASELQNFITIFDVLSSFHVAKDGYKIEPVRNVMISPTWLILTECRLVYWISRLLDCTTSQERFRVARETWLPSMLLGDCRSKNDIVIIQREMTTVIDLIKNYIIN